MSRKRERPDYGSRQYVSSSSTSTSFRRSKRARPFHPHQSNGRADSGDRLQEPTTTTTNDSKQSSPAVVVVTGLDQSCSVLDLKSRFEMYGSISRLRIDRGGLGFITFRSSDSAAAAINASLDPSFPITVDSRKVQVSWANDPFPQWREGVGLSSKEERPLSKLLRAEVPLRRHGRGIKQGMGTVSPRNGLDMPYKGREIVAYDDLL
ncbi:uncharacterized protein At1g27050 [Macadamia integrifolia]|uniref:uncharacterized protein At1g27050 n=1 Tax=Macadamia integrifolia TaxID=60698 RepID=UPI001C52762C|nr:uncharacterized protein At1g27050 [Macadamia integrifolia]